MRVLRLGDILRERNINNQEFANMCGLSRGFISQLANHKSLCTIDNLLHMAKVLDIDVSEMFYPTKDKPVYEQLYRVDEDGNYRKTDTYKRVS